MTATAARSFTAFHLHNVDPSWHPILQKALATVDPSYLNQLYHNSQWLPGKNQIFNAFSLPLSEVHYILMGESPYPRADSANGYAFWDARVGEIWSQQGLSKTVNRATSLRNIIKMLLIAENLLDPANTSQAAIAAIPKLNMVMTNTALFQNFLRHGFLLLNASLVLQTTPVRLDAIAWRPFMQVILNYLIKTKPHVKLLLFGAIATAIDPLITTANIEKLYAEHPYNISFITNPEVLDFFKPLHLLRQLDLRH